GASLFLLNPNGIVFGPNARLDIGGSFLGSTADNVVFQDGSVFSATEANAPPLLTINVPVGLQMGTNPGAIQVRGTSHELTPNSSVNLTQFDRSQSPRGLQVGTGNTVALIGDGVFFDGGILTAEAGHIEVGSVVRGRVTLNYADGGWRFGYDNAQELGNLQLVGRSALDASSPDNIGELSLLNGGGSIGLQGDRILLQNSLVLIQNQGTQPSGNIAIQASDTVEMRQETPGSPNSSGVVNLATGTGNGGGIAVSARRLTLQDRFAVFAMTSGTGAAGNIEIDTSEALELTRSRIQVRTFGAGNTGDIAVSTGQLKIQDTASITAASFSAGLGGNVTIDAESIDVVGSRPETGSISFIGVVTLGDGDAGNLTIDTSRLSVRGGGRINAAT
ncbi:MAG TPA: filamentous hemagglutinin N-terminal domain-containing protein, partial [Oscillatoriales cyanobacterium M59_W2019_021]